MSELTDDITDFLAVAGLSVSPWQREVIDRVFATGADGKAAEFKVDVRASRNTAMNDVLMRLVVAWLFLFDEKLVLWSTDSRRPRPAAPVLLRGIRPPSSLLPRA